MPTSGLNTRLFEKTNPTNPVSILDIKSHLRIDYFDEDSVLQSYLTAAREQAEMLTGRAFGERQYELVVYRAGLEIELPYPPLVNVDSVEVGGSTASYTLRDVEPAVVVLDEDPGDEPVTVTYTAGSPVSGRAKQAIRVLVAHWETYRTPVVQGKVQEVPHTFERLLRTLRVW
jgi:uncharacterized phiE125 gp8 family phage protein